MSLFNRLSFIYQDKIVHHTIKFDILQQRLFNCIIDILDRSHLGKTKWLWKVKNFILRKPPPPKGLYIYGSVGTGKSYISRLAINNIPAIVKVGSWHCNEFVAMLMQHIGKGTGSKAVNAMTKNLVDQYDLIFIDEFDVMDITVALLFRTIILQLFKQGVIILFTSNRPLEELYLHGLQRQSFLPLINYIKQNCFIYQMDGEDYRKLFKDATNFIRTDNPRLVVDPVRQQWKKFAAQSYPNQTPTILMHGERKINGLLIGKSFYSTFHELCYSPLAASDYRRIGRVSDFIFIDNFTKPQIQEKDVLRRMIWMVDELYESGKVLYASFNYDYNDLQNYANEMFEISRMVSRLYEMDRRHFDI